MVLKQEDRGKEERGEARKHRRDFDVQSKKKTDLFSCQWKLGGLEIPKDGLLSMIKAIAQQQEEMQGGCEKMLIFFSLGLEKARPVGGLYHWAVTSN